MRSTPHCRSLPATTSLAGFDPFVVEFIEELRHRNGTPEGQLRKHRYVALHFLIWLDLSGIDLVTVDGEIIESFLQHDCRCTASSGPVGFKPWRKRRTSSRLMSFIRFLERTGRIDSPGELEDNFQLLDAFLEGLRNDGYAPSTVSLYRFACSGLIVWLHLARLRLGDLSPEILARFHNRRFICSIPGLFHGHGSDRPGAAYETELRGFLKHLASIRRIKPLEQVPGRKILPSCLDRYKEWLERHRGGSPEHIRQQVRLIAEMLTGLGDDPDAYDAALIRQVLFERMKPWAQGYARRLTSTTRMYLRFLASEGRVAPALVAAVPKVPTRRLSDLPRYIAADDVERAIATCGEDPMGVRDRAILLLLARLALRAGDIVALRLDDIDWDRAAILVSGKSRRAASLPLPQDVGDALHAYIATVRPRVDEQKVFFCMKAPCRPFSDSSIVSAVAERALNRARVKTTGGRGAHAFRHSQATALLRSGAPLNVIQTLLRHDSANTTLIYAKTDAVMLQEVAQPWIGEMGQ